MRVGRMPAVAEMRLPDSTDALDCETEDNGAIRLRWLMAVKPTPGAPRMFVGCGCGIARGRPAPADAGSPEASFDQAALLRRSARSISAGVTTSERPRGMISPSR